MSNRIAFQTQLASIMEVLANAAVAEICKLVDDDYAIINLQMTQCQRENKALKRKLHILELKMARGFAERRISSLNRTNRVQVSALSDKYRNQSNGVCVCVCVVIKPYMLFCCQVYVSHQINYQGSCG